MKSYRILTLGAIGRLWKDKETEYKEEMDWRNRIESCIKSRTNVPVTFVHPPKYQQSQDDKMRMWEINQIKESDIIILNLSTFTNDITNFIQLGMIDAINNLNYKHIDVIGIEMPSLIHPWIEPVLTGRFLTTEEAADYIVNYLLI